VYLTRQERGIVIFLVCTLAAGVILKLIGFGVYPGNRAVQGTTDSLYVAKVSLVDSLVRGYATVQSPGSQESSMVSAQQKFQVNINVAGVESLQKLPGIGPVMAKRIIAHRQKNGYFKSFKDLLEVKGIGPATLEKIRPFITLTSDIP